MNIDLENMPAEDIIELYRSSIKELKKEGLYELKMLSENWVNIYQYNTIIILLVCQIFKLHLLELKISMQ